MLSQVWAFCVDVVCFPQALLEKGAEMDAELASIKKEIEAQKKQVALHSHVLCVRPSKVRTILKQC